MVGNRFVVLVIAVAGLFGCDKKSELEYTPPVFPDTLCVEARVLNDTFIMNGADQLFLYKDYLIVSTTVNDYKFHIFDKNSGRHLKSFGAIGRGPGEIRHVGPVTLDQSNGELIAVRINLKTAVVYNIDSVVNTEKWGYRELSFEGLPFLESLYYNQKHQLFLAEGKGSEEDLQYRFMKLDAKGNITEYYSEYPEDIQAPYDPNLFTRYSVKSFSPDGSRVVAGLRRGAVMEILNMRDGIHRHAIKRFIKPEVVKRDNYITFSLDAVRGFRDITTTDDYIYTIYRGNRNLSLARNICVFDWDGNPLQLYHTPYNVGSICIDGPHNRIYAGVYNEKNESFLVTFDLSGAVKKSYPLSEDIEEPVQGNFPEVMVGAD